MPRATNVSPRVLRLPQFASFSLWGLFLHSASRHQLGQQTTWHMLAWYAVPNVVLLLANVAEIIVAVESVRNGALAKDVRLIQNAFRGASDQAAARAACVPPDRPSPADPSPYTAALPLHANRSRVHTARGCGGDLWLAV